jgi:hypothetical protein
MQYLLSSYLTQYFLGPIYGGVEEDPRAEVQDPRLVAFNIATTYATGGATLHGR